MSLEDDILKLGRNQPLPEDRLRSLLKRTLGIMRASQPDDFDGRTDDEIVEEVLRTRKTELALVSGLAVAQTPRFAHDCDGCHWLGQFEKVDLWWCPSPSSRNLDSVIGRYGNEPHEYAASHPPAAFAGPEDYLRRAEAWYLTALQRAEAMGLYVPPSDRAKSCPDCAGDGHVYGERGVTREEWDGTGEVLTCMNCDGQGEL